MLKTYLGPVESSGPELPAPRNRPGHLRRLRQVVTPAAHEAPVRHRPDRQGFPQRDHSRQLHLPHARVRADGDRVLRAAGLRRGAARALDRHALGLVHGPRYRPDNLRHFEHPKEKLSHYSKRTADIEYRFGFQGSEWGELEGVANRTDFDLKTHSEPSGKDLRFFDQAANEKYMPYVIEPAVGLTRALMAFLSRRTTRKKRRPLRAESTSAPCFDSTPVWPP